MRPSIHHSTLKPILTWSNNGRTVALINPQQQKICEFQIRTHHNGRELLSPEIALPEVNEITGAADTGFIKSPLVIPQQRNQVGSE